MTAERRTARKSRIERRPNKREAQLRFLMERVANLSAKWGMPDAADAITVCFSTRLSRSLGRADLSTGRISLAAFLRSDPALLDQALCHELAHLIAFLLVGQSERPHGPTWKILMQRAGYEPRVRLSTSSLQSSTLKPKLPRRYLHRCPICHFSRMASRRMMTWRCADCTAASLDGQLEIELLGQPH
jgi:predicted SprT family Zn-dependent metalloprotease